MSKPDIDICTAEAPDLKWALNQQHDKVADAEAQCAELEDYGETLFEQLILRARGSYEERELHVYDSAEWMRFVEAQVTAKVKLNMEQRRYEILRKAFLSELRGDS